MIIRDGEKILLRKRPFGGLLAGLYELPNVLGDLKEKEIVAYTKDRGLEPLRVQRLPDAKHIFSLWNGYAGLWMRCCMEPLMEGDRVFAAEAEFMQMPKMPKACRLFSGACRPDPDRLSDPCCVLRRMRRM